MTCLDERTFVGRDILSIDSLSREDIIHILDHAKCLKEKTSPDLLRGQIMGSCFFEPSTRTRLSFEAAMGRMGGSSIGFSDETSTSTQKGESLADSVRTVEQYVDVLVLRHPKEGAAQLAADICSKPVINAGDGANQHPTQTLLDLFSIRECQGRLDELNIALVGDLKYGRTVHSLAMASCHFNMRLYFVAPESLEMPKAICDRLREQRVKFSFHRSIEEVMPKADIIYMTRVQKERFSSPVEYQRVKDSFVLTPDSFDRAADHLKVLHPLPRVNEIDKRVDDTDYAYYFQQAENGLHVRKALLGLVLGKLH